MAKHTAEIWSLALDQHGRPVWHNGKDKATYEAPGKSAMFYPGAFGNQLQPSTQTIVIVGDNVKEDKWKEYTDKDGNKYYHNPTKGPSTWDKPKDFDEKQRAGNPKPPEKPKPKKKKKGKYDSDRKGLL
eukprot:g11183.t1